MVFAKGFFLKRYPPGPASLLRYPYLYFIITLSCYFVNTFFKIFSAVAVGLSPVWAKPKARQPRLPLTDKDIYLLSSS
jgi:hypothetical protein